MATAPVEVPKLAVVIMPVLDTEKLVELIRLEAKVPVKLIPVVSVPLVLVMFRPVPIVPPLVVIARPFVSVPAVEVTLIPLVVVPLAALRTIEIPLVWTPLPLVKFKV